MKEDYLHYLWKFKKFNFHNLQTTQKESVQILSVGNHNLNSGPDFFNARLIIDAQEWAGNVEIHVNSSDWYVHHHEKDKNYNNVILHVVWNHDLEVYRNSNECIPTIEIKSLVTEEQLKSYDNLLAKKKFINCENDLAAVDSFIYRNWLERMYFDRLEEKVRFIESELCKSKNDWEGVLFKLLMKNFGLKVNGDSFYSIANAIDYSIIRKVQSKSFQLEGLLFGLGGLLDHDSKDDYFLKLKNEYEYIKCKYQISDLCIPPVNFFKLRPASFPTIRLSQVSALLSSHLHLFSNIMKTNTVKEIYELFNVKASSYWETHYTFGKTSKKSQKKIAKGFIDLIIINTIIPVKFCYARSIGVDINDEIYTIMSSVNKENNNVIRNFKTAGLEINSALESQSLLQSYNQYCSKNKCLQCAIGSYLIKQ